MGQTVYNTVEATAKAQIDAPAWYVEDNHLCRVYKTENWKGALLLTNAIGHLSEIAWHHPDLLVSYKQVTVRLTDHAAKGISDKDFALAAKIESFVQWHPENEASALTGTPAEPAYRYIVKD